ncbi:HEXXH motif-containing putative peptide modification protein [Nonomuraea sp. NPDC050786]|uniref:aKG-HExxH-type peptide beta-hydroxylase n=1 Tax=Nonomuraea sp. NPDC050786 TaxID=3154840 RepID=UPI0033FF302E
MDHRFQRVVARTHEQRPARLRLIGQLLGQLTEEHLYLPTPPSAALYASAHQLLYQARIAAMRRDHDGVAEVAGLIRRLPELPAPREGVEFLLVPASACTWQHGEQYASDVPVLDPPKATRSWLGPEQSAELQAAVDLLADVGMLEWVNASCGVVVWTTRSPLRGTSISYTLRSLEGTIVTDWPDDPVRLAENLLHEATHTWLNEAVRVLGESLQGPDLFSPWKQRMRPALGIAHSGAAFTNVAHFLHRVLESGAGSHDARIYARRRLSYELDQLELASSAIREAYALIRDSDLAGLLTDHFDQLHGTRAAFAI